MERDWEPAGSIFAAPSVWSSEGVIEELSIQYQKAFKLSPYKTIISWNAFSFRLLCSIEASTSKDACFSSSSFRFLDAPLNTPFTVSWSAIAFGDYGSRKETGGIEELLAFPSFQSLWGVLFQAGSVTKWDVAWKKEDRVNARQISLPYLQIFIDAAAQPQALFEIQLSINFLSLPIWEMKWNDDNGAGERDDYAKRMKGTLTHLNN